MPPTYRPTPLLPPEAMQKIQGALRLMLGQEHGQDKSSGIAEMAGVSIPALRRILKQTQFSHRLETLLDDPKIAEQTRKALRNVGHSAKEVEPKFIDNGVDALAMKIQPYSRGGEVLKLFRDPISKPASTADADISLEEIMKTVPKELLLQHRLFGNIKADSGSDLFGYATQPLADTSIFQRKSDTRVADINKMHELMRIVEKVAKQNKYMLPDFHTGNVGMFRGRPVIIDAGSVSPLDEVMQQMFADKDAKFKRMGGELPTFLEKIGQTLSRHSAEPQLTPSFPPSSSTPNILPSEAQRIQKFGRPPSR